MVSSRQIPQIVVTGWLAFGLSIQATAMPQKKSVRLYDDPRVVAWSRTYLAGEEDAVLQSVEKDLRSANPHPFAAQVWTTIHKRRKRLAQVWNQLQDPQLRDSLGVLPEIYLLRDQHRNRELLEKYPPNKAGEITDVCALVALAASAGDVARRMDKFAYLLAAAHLYPMHFQIAWMFEDVLRSNFLRDRAADEIQLGGALYGTPVGEYLTSFLAIRLWTSLDRLAAIDRWLSAYPSDTRAMAARGFVLSNQRYDQEAASIHLKALEAFPFYHSSAHYATKPLLRLDKEAEARALLQRVGVWYTPTSERREVWVVRKLAQALRETGNKGRSRQVLETALQRWPKDAKLLAEQAELEIADNRKEQAVIYAQSAWKQAPDDLDNRIRLMKTLQQAGELQEALDLFEEFDKVANFRSRALYAHGSQILGALERHKSRIALMERALKDYPASTWMHAVYAEALMEAGRPQEAWAKLRHALELNPEYSWGAARVFEYLTAAEGEGTPTEQIEEWIRTHPWQKAFWEQRNKLLVGKNATEQQLALWREAMQQNPGRSWPVESLVDVLTEEESWEEAQQAVETLFTTEPVSASNRISRHWLRADLVARWTTHERIDSAVAEQALLDLEAFKAEYGLLGTYHAIRETLLRSVDRKAEAAQDQLARARLDPDDTAIFHDLVARYRKELGSVNTIGRGALIVERNPYDGQKLVSVVHKHVLWSGSPIIGLRIIQQIKERGLDSRKYASLEGRALGQLGDSLADFKSNYQQVGNIGGSDRYIGWYENARRAVLSYDKKRVKVDYDAEFPTAEIILPNREILRRVDHPISGKIMSLSKGPAFVRAEYDATGDNLVNIKSSSGAEVSIEYYDDSDLINQLITSEGQELRLVYNTRAKPIEVYVKGTGAIQVTYDDNDDIIATKLIGDDGKEVGHFLALQVTKAMNELLGLVKLVEEARQNVPSLPFRDDQRDALRDTYQKLRWGVDEDGNRAEAGLVLSRYLVEHLSDDAVYAGEARGILSDVINTAQGIDTPAARLIAGEAVMLWYRLAWATKPEGLPSDEFNQWSALRAWLLDQAMAGDDTRFRDWFNAIDSERLELFRDDVWLPESDLENSGFWRRHGNNRLFPKTTLPAPTTALVRRSGDVVVGSQTGLSVLRRGFWEWFGFDDKIGRFSATTDIYALSISSEVLSIAETDDDVLWIGTAKGLYALEDGYEGPVRRWRTVEDGLPSPRIEHLLSRGTEVLVGTARGLRSASLAGISNPLPTFAGMQIRLLAMAGHGDAAAEAIADTLRNLDTELSSKQSRVLRAVWDEAETEREGAMAASQVVLAALEPDQATATARAKASGTLITLQGRPVCRSDVELVDELLDLIDRKDLGLTAEESDRLGEIYFLTNEPDAFMKDVAELLTDSRARDDPARIAAQQGAHAATLERLIDHLQSRRVGASDCASIEQFRAVLDGIRWALSGAEIDEIESATSDKGIESAVTQTILLLAPDEARNAARQVTLRKGVERLQALAKANVPVLVGTDTALYVTKAGNQRLQVAPWPVDDAVWSPSLAQIVVLRGTDVYGISWNRAGVAGKPKMIPGQQNLRFTNQLYGLAVVQVPGVGEAVAMLTDEGLSFYRDWHFESMPLPLEQQRLGLQVGPHTVASSGGDMYFLTHEGLYSFERGHVRWAKDHRVYDLVADQDLGRVYIARGSTIDVVDENDPALELNPLGWYAAQHLALDNEGRLIANDGHTIIRFDKNSTSAQELFDASPTTSTPSEKYGNGPVRDLLVASDGTIWVASGGSVFRWKDGDMEEFSFFLEPERFPSRTHMISSVVETIDGKLWVIASDEGHLIHRGIRLQGGLLEWTGEAFRRTRKPGAYRLITGYTQVDDDTAIVGTTSGFARHTNDGSFQSFYAMKDATYRKLREYTPLLWLGRKGAQLGKQSWLFPSAGGVLLYHKGRWRYPGRLNQMLPDDRRFGQYGGRTTHAVAVDGQGRIYAGTDRGLLVYEAGGSVESLLIDNGLSSEAFGDSAVERLQQLGEILLDKIDPDSEPGRILARLRKATQKIDELQSALGEDDSAMAGRGLGNAVPSNTAGDVQQKPPARSTFKEQLQQRAQERQRLLHQLENEHYGLFQMLELNPHDLTALHTELPAGQAVVQYLPTPQKLFIQLVTHKGVQIREVDVAEEELYRRAQRATVQLTSDSKNLDGINKLLEAKSPLAEQGLEGLHTELAWLYDQLLRPVERELAGMEQVFIVPVGKLTYLPFPALVYEQEGRAKYAVERFAMGTLPSLFHLRLVLKKRASYLEERGSLLVGDPDGSLPAARKEVQAISITLPAALPPLIGSDATIENFRRQAPGSRIVHLATHGVLNHSQPAESYLLMANGYRLSVVDIALLDLKETDLVVLSACESGIGRDGLEYATLARAFAHARVPSVVASLWMVNDSATRQLMSNFYSNIVQGQDVFSAMAAAQRAMIQDEEWRIPAAWSGFVVFGKP